MNLKRSFSRQSRRVLAIVISVMLVIGGVFSIYAETDSPVTRPQVSAEHEGTHAQEEICPTCGGCACDDETCTACGSCGDCICGDYTHINEECPVCDLCDEYMCSGKGLVTSDGAAISEHEGNENHSCHVYNAEVCGELSVCGKLKTACPEGDCYLDGSKLDVCTDDCHEHGENCVVCPADGECMCENCYTTVDGVSESCLKCGHTHFHNDESCAMCLGDCGSCFCADCFIATAVCPMTVNEFVAGYCETCFDTGKVNFEEIYARIYLLEGTESYTIDLSENIVQYGEDSDVVTLTAEQLAKLDYEITEIQIEGVELETIPEDGKVVVPIEPDFKGELSVEVYASVSARNTTHGFSKYYEICVTPHMHTDECEGVCADCGGCICPECLEVGEDNGCDTICYYNYWGDICPECKHHDNLCACYDGLCAPEAEYTVQNIEVGTEGDYAIPVYYGFTVDKKLAAYNYEVQHRLKNLSAKINGKDLPMGGDGIDYAFLPYEEYIKNAKAGDKLKIDVSVEVEHANWEESKKLDYVIEVVFYADDEIRSIVMDDGYEKNVYMGKAYNGTAHVEFGSDYKGGCTASYCWYVETPNDEFCTEEVPCKFDPATKDISIKYDTNDFKEAYEDNEGFLNVKLVVVAKSDNGCEKRLDVPINLIWKEAKIAAVDPVKYSTVTLKEGEAVTLQFKVTKAEGYTGAVYYVVLDDEGNEVTTGYKGSKYSLNGEIVYNDTTSTLSVPIKVNDKITESEAGLTVLVGTEKDFVYYEASADMTMYFVKKETETTFAQLKNTITFDKDAEKYVVGDTVKVTVSCNYPKQPKEGDIRFVPIEWQVNPIGEWTHTPEESPYVYTAEVSGLKAGEYTFTVTYRDQVYKDGAWQDPDVDHYAMLTSDFTVNPPASAGDSTGSGNTPSTGDFSHVLPMLMFIMSGAILAGSFIDWRYSKYKLRKAKLQG